MKKILLAVSFLLVASLAFAGQRWLIVVNTEDQETAWNALRVANYALAAGESVSVFLLGKGVTVAQERGEPFDVYGLLQKFSDNGGKVYACKACLRLHKIEPSQSCPVGTLKILYDLIKEADKVLTF